MRIVYLHGFASSPMSGKAQYFRRQFARFGIDMEIPQLDQGDFRNLTISGQLAVIERTVGNQPAILMGSSLGGYLAALYATSHASIGKLILMAPAFEFPRRWRERYPPAEMERWKREGAYPIFHYGANAMLPLSYRFVEDSLHYENEPAFAQPALIFHGTRDEVVPPAVSERFAASHPNVKLRLLDSGHELMDVLDEMWQDTREFLEFQSP